MKHFLPVLLLYIFARGIYLLVKSRQFAGVTEPESGVISRGPLRLLIRSFTVHSRLIFEKYVTRRFIGLPKNAMKARLYVAA